MFAIVERYFNRPASPAPMTIDGKPNYNMGPVKFATIAAIVSGITGFPVYVIRRASNSHFQRSTSICNQAVLRHASAPCINIDCDLRLRWQRP